MKNIFTTKDKGQRTKDKEQRTKDKEQSPSANVVSGSSSFSEAQRNGSSSDCPFAGGWNVRNNQCKRISWDEFMLMIDNPQHRERCARIAQGEKDLKIQSPYITPHAQDFTDGRRSNKSAVPSGCVMLDVDHQDPDEIWQRIQDRARSRDVIYGVSPNDPIGTPTHAHVAETANDGEAQKGVSTGVLKDLLSEQGIILCAKSVSATGFRAIARLAQGETSIEGINRLAAFFGVEPDTACKDLARASFLMPRSYIYYLDTEQRTKDKEQRTKNESPSASETSGSSSSSEAQRNGSSSTISPIIARWLNQNGGTPAVGRRNNTLFQLALDFRYITDFDEAWLFRELPHFDLPDDEVRSVIHSAVREERLRGLPKRLVAATENLPEDNNNSQEEITPAELRRLIVHRPLAPLPELPQSITRLLDILPEHFRAATFIGLLAPLGTVASSLRFRYLDGQMHSPSFLSIILAPSGTGKSCVRKPLDLILAPIMEQDEQARQQENAYKEALIKAKNKKEQPEQPHVAVRIHPLNITLANLVRYMSLLGELHSFSYCEEIDFATRVEKVGYQAKKELYKFAYDNGQWGSSTLTGMNINQAVFYNLLLAGTPGSVFQFLGAKDIEGGLVSRCSFAQLPQQFAADMPFFDDYSLDTTAYVTQIMNKLMNTRGIHEDEDVLQAAKAWNAKTQHWATMTQSRAVDYFRRRACSMGFRAGMLISVLEKLEAEHRTKDTEQRTKDKEQRTKNESPTANVVSGSSSFSEAQRNGPSSSCAARVTQWVADYCFTMQMRLFGDAYEQQARDDEKRLQGLFSQPLLRKGKPKQLFTALPDEFTEKDVIRLRLEANQSTKHTSIRMILTRWIQAGKITETQPQHYKKTIQ